MLNPLFGFKNYVVIMALQLGVSFIRLFKLDLVKGLMMIL
jgi:hypothetical protein